MIDPFSLHFCIVALFMAILGFALVADLQSFLIPNRICIALVLLYPAHVLTAGAPVDWVGALGVAGLIFAVGLLPFSAGGYRENTQAGQDLDRLAGAGYVSKHETATSFEVYASARTGAEGPELGNAWDVTRRQVTGVGGGDLLVRLAPRLHATAGVRGYRIQRGTSVRSTLGLRWRF